MEFILFIQYLLLNQKQGLLFSIVTKCCDTERKKVHFGSRGSSTYLDNKDEAKRKAYIARHQVREDFNNPLTAAALSVHLLWGKTTSLKENIALFKKKFNL